MNTYPNASLDFDIEIAHLRFLGEP